jgi:hypothetical protein
MRTKELGTYQARAETVWDRGEPEFRASCPVCRERSVLRFDERRHIHQTEGCQHYADVDFANGVWLTFDTD